MKQELIKWLKRIKEPRRLCNAFGCQTECTDCPFANDENFSKLIRELEEK